MKKLIKALICASFIVPSVASAGTAIIPTFKVWQGAASCYSISNVSNVSADITVRFYGQNGEEYIGPITSYSGLTALGSTFNLQPHQTSKFCLERNNQHIYGYGVIESSTTELGQPFLVAYGYYNTMHTQSLMGERMISINGGMPF